MAKTLRIFRTTILILVAAALLSACYPSYHLTSPAADAVIRQPTTHIEGPTGPANFTLTVDGINKNSEIRYDPSGDNFFADLMIAAGMHTIVASGDAYCNWCSGQFYHVSDTRMVCVADAPANTAKTLSAQGDGMGWSSTDPRTVALAANNGTTMMTQWTLTPKGTGLVSIPGIIRSRQFPCWCLRSPDNTNKAVVGLAPCDSNDPYQVWDGTREQLVNGTGLYQFRNEGVGAYNAGCLAEGNANDNTAGKLVQDFCNGTADRLWKVQRIDNGQFESDQTPWAQ